MPEIIEQPFRLYQDDPVIAVADGVANTWSDIWKYQVPIGVTLILKPEHTFALYLAVSGPTVVGDSTCQVKIEKRDASDSDTIILYGPQLYINSKEFQAKQSMAHLQVASDGVVINEREYLVIAAKDDGTISETVCYFELRIAKIRKALGA